VVLDNVFVEEEAGGTVTDLAGELSVWLVGGFVPEAAKPPSTLPTASNTAARISTLRRRSRRSASRNSASSSSAACVDGSERVVMRSAGQGLQHLDQLLAPVAVSSTKVDQLLHLGNHDTTLWSTRDRDCPAAADL
jgi:hypothetical protein